MPKYFLVLFFCFSTFFAAVPAWSFMPTYPDDKEFDMCARINSWDECAKDEMQRALRVVKQEYRTILTTPEIMQWHSSVDENVAILRDMYDSWTAFRTRLCSLSSKASLYMEPLVEEKTSCNLYYILHHRDHLNSILLLMLKQAPDDVNDFTFLKIYDHDDEYQSCIDAKEDDCIENELKRSNRIIKNYYKTFSEDEFVGKWNNAPDLKAGNYRDMYDSWIAYRNRMCALAVWAYQNYYGPKSMDPTTCLQFYNREKLETMENLLLMAHSALDDAHEMDEDPSDTSHIFTTERDDGGLAEGRTITPLERRVDPGDSNLDDKLIPDEPVAEETKEPEEKRNIPAWAQ